jgi:hypothetical protein
MLMSIRNLNLKCHNIRIYLAPKPFHIDLHYIGILNLKENFLGHFEINEEYIYMDTVDDLNMINPRFCPL